MQSTDTSDNKSKKYSGKNADRSWYQKLLLSQKFKLNTAIGLVLTAVGVLIVAISGPEMTHHWQVALHAGVGVIALLAGLWFFSRGLRYESQLDAIRIMKRNRNFNGGNKRKGPRNAGPKKD
jgi:cytochrome c biogenesis protein CcdA